MIPLPSIPLPKNPMGSTGLPSLDLQMSSEAKAYGGDTFLQTGNKTFTAASLNNNGLIYIAAIVAAIYLLNRRTK